MNEFSHDGSEHAAEAVLRHPFDPDSESASDAVMEALASVSGTTEDDLDPVESIVDPIVFDALIRRQRRPIQVRFASNGYDIRVSGNGEITVSGTLPDGGHVQEYRFDPDESPSTAVVRAVAVQENVEPKELTPLYEIVEPDALDSLLDTSNNGDGSRQITFQYEGYRVSLRDDRQIRVQPLRD